MYQRNYVFWNSPLLHQYDSHDNSIFSPAFHMWFWRNMSQQLQSFSCISSTDSNWHPFYTKFRFWEQEEVCGERLGLYSGCESTGVLLSAKGPRKILLGLFTLDDETNALFLNIVYLNSTKENVLVHISMAKAVMWMCHNLNIICTLSVWLLFSSPPPHNFLFHFLSAFAVMKSVHQFGHVCISASINSAPIGRTFMKFRIGGFY